MSKIALTPTLNHSNTHRLSSDIAGEFLSNLLYQGRARGKNLFRSGHSAAVHGKPFARSARAFLRPNRLGVAQHARAGRSGASTAPFACSPSIWPRSTSSNLYYASTLTTTCSAATNTGSRGFVGRKGQRVSVTDEGIAIAARQLTNISQHCRHMICRHVSGSSSTLNDMARSASTGTWKLRRKICLLSMSARLSG